MPDRDPSMLRRLSFGPMTWRPLPQRRRPLGLWLLPLFDAVLMGLVPCVAALVAFFGAEAGARPPATDVFWPLLMGAGTLVAAEATWRGERWGRVALTALVTLYYGVVVMGTTPLAGDLPFGLGTLALAEAQATLSPAEARLVQVAHVVRATFWIGLHGWCLFLSDARHAFASGRRRR
jgi:hypothetical protein